MKRVRERLKIKNHGSRIPFPPPSLEIEHLDPFIIYIKRKIIIFHDKSVLKKNCFFFREECNDLILHSFIS